MKPAFPRTETGCSETGVIAHAGWAGDCLRSGEMRETGMPPDHLGWERRTVEWDPPYNAPLSRHLNYIPDPAFLVAFL